jgi:hypothetical protein
MVCLNQLDFYHEIHARIKSYLSTCLKNDVGSREALELPFKGELPDFVIQAGEKQIGLN